MTREEAIEILENTTFIAPLIVDVDTALEMAISALSENKGTDAERIKQNLSELAQYNADMLKTFNAGKELAEKEKWISVSERLPEKNRAVLTYVDTGVTKTYCLAYWNGRVKGWEEWIGYRMLETEMGYKVLAWMPLPEPYMENENQTEKDILHKAIDNTKIAEDVYPNLRKELHKAVDLVDMKGGK